MRDPEIGDMLVYTGVITKIRQYPRNLIVETKETSFYSNCVGLAITPKPWEPTRGDICYSSSFCGEAVISEVFGDCVYYRFRTPTSDWTPHKRSLISFKSTYVKTGELT